MATNKSKQNVMRRMANVVKSHVEDVCDKVMKEAKDNAKDIHNVEIPDDLSAKALKKRLLDGNRKLAENVRLTKKEFIQSVKEGFVQAKAAIKNDKEAFKTEEDAFFDEFGEDFLNEFDFSDEDDETIGEHIAIEYNLPDIPVLYGKEPQPNPVEPEPEKVILSKWDYQQISSLIFVLVQLWIDRSCYAPEKANTWFESHVEPIMKVIEGVLSQSATFIDNTNFVPEQSALPPVVQELLDEKTAEVAPNQGMEDAGFVPLVEQEGTAENFCYIPRPEYKERYETQVELSNVAIKVRKAVRLHILQDAELNATVLLVHRILEALTQYFEQEDGPNGTYSLLRFYDQNNDRQAPFDVLIIAMLNGLPQADRDLMERTIRLESDLWKENE